MASFQAGSFNLSDAALLFALSELPQPARDTANTAASATEQIRFVLDNISRPPYFYLTHDLTQMNYYGS
ncbi:hypothetical protein GCM10010913_15910 [Paenibacillus aceti]|uniref:Uncharacterized protein n=1 Tax=Paenibacillus aceti TaxID=1820010 RepID=A0ABQ1VSF9_9BACL|nr:hypothetical protein GCM10010913_15910 [Paenibacillus aceti]